MIIDITTNCLGTAEILAKFPKMRKPQSFTTYAIEKGSNAENITIQSGTRMGTINTDTGKVRLTKSYPNGAYFIHLQMGVIDVFHLSPLDLQSVKNAVFVTADEDAGKDQNGAILSDNSGAINIFNI